MNPKHLAILGAGIIGAGALIFMGNSQAQALPGGIGGPLAKKETAITGEPTFTETIETTAPLAPIINYIIDMPAPDFPTAPAPTITEPWWVKDLDPSPPSKKESSSGGYLARRSQGMASSPIPEKGSAEYKVAATQYDVELASELRVWMGKDPSKKQIQTTSEKYGVDFGGN